MRTGCGSATLGAATHVLWDAFTHSDLINWGTEDPRVAELSGIQLVQHGRGLLGLAWPSSTATLLRALRPSSSASDLQMVPLLYPCTEALPPGEKS
ncbi:hypothetical protein DMH18_26175 [Streptomyces sp. WAC 06783]|uniref:DUF4184 family protein n=1 Tax=Streptomyces sp. WAC 06783 TaxID=2203211 RepID=UPI000F73D381|nr:DUF4184 family protein [Streptomyces sp. WAC 06783]RSO06942.1 hypothetical protein DMH18_26175 [Streptomyces sp. WAC 06783]